jgi:hypothetical protein
MILLVLLRATFNPTVNVHTVIANINIGGPFSAAPAYPSLRLTVIHDVKTK